MSEAHQSHPLVSCEHEQQNLIEVYIHFLSTV